MRRFIGTVATIATAPITIYGGGRISTVSDEDPPILETIELEFDRHGSLQTAGLPISWSSTVDKDVPRLRDHTKATWDNREAGPTFMRLLQPSDQPEPKP
jgi:hypothetical protein